MLTVEVLEVWVNVLEEPWQHVGVVPESTLICEEKKKREKKYRGQINRRVQQEMVTE